ncbi:membrane protein [Sciscionella sediminilitoris]|uniref:membrane protein n=1 Tax=Sciscionella sediminilitoris TaxID=1445613 RepID=UPI0004DFC753|nr:membrane protein [Sciscionella sp. SE31]
MDEIWINGATGRCGRAIAAKLAERGAPLGLLGRNAERLRAVAGEIGGAPRIVVADSPEAVGARIAEHAPAVVVNTVGPFSETAPPILRALPPGTHYTDLSNDLSTLGALSARHEQLAAAGSTAVPGAGFGVLGTESVVLKLCAGKPAPRRVRVNRVAAIGSDGAAAVGEALASTLVEGIVKGGRRYADGKLVRAAIGSEAETLSLPDGRTARMAAGPSGELEAARRASGAPFVVAGSGELPSGAVARAVFPVLGALLSVSAIGRFAKRGIARMRVPESTGGSEYSWAHARVSWPDGETRQGWLRTGEGMGYTTSVAAEVAYRLAEGKGRPGAHTPGALFGPELAEAAGGTFLLEEAHQTV